MVSSRLARARSLVGWTVVASLALTASALAHLSTGLGRAAAADLTEQAIDARIGGSVRIGAMTRLGLRGAELRDVRVLGPSGEPVLWADRMTVELALGASLTRGALVLGPCEIDGGEMRFTRGHHDQLALVDALEVRGDRATFPVELRHVRIHHQTIRIDLPGLPAITMRDVGGVLDVWIAHRFVAEMHRLAGHVSFPIVDVGFDRLSGHIRGRSAHPMVVSMVLDLEIADPSMTFRYTAPHVVGHEGDARASIELGADVPDDSGVATHRRAESAEAAITRHDRGTR